MADNVIALQTFAKQANANTVDLLEHALSEAKEGRIQEIAAAVIYADGSTGWRRSSSESISKMIGAASILFYQLNKDADETR